MKYEVIYEDKEIKEGRREGREKASKEERKED